MRPEKSILFPPPGFNRPRYLPTSSGGPAPAVNISPPSPAPETRVSVRLEDNNRWSDEETTDLLNLRLEMNPQFQEKNIKSVHLWEEIARKLAEKGYQQRTGVNCSRKHSNCCQYLKKKAKQAATTAGGKKRKNYKFSNLLEISQPQNDTVLHSNTNSDQNVQEQPENDIVFPSDQHVQTEQVPTSTSSGVGEKRKLKDLTDGLIKYAMKQHEKAKFLEGVVDKVDKITSDTAQSLDTTSKGLSTISARMLSCNDKRKGLMSEFVNIQQDDSPPPSPIV